MQDTKYYFITVPFVCILCFFFKFNYHSLNSSTVTNLNTKVEILQTSNTLMKEDLAIAKNTVLQLQHDNSNLRREKEELIGEYNRQMEVLFTLT